MKQHAPEQPPPRKPAAGLTLRQQAEERLHERRGEQPSAEELQQTPHELRVHQIELEIQNEELRQAQAALEVMRTRYFDLYDLAPVGYLTLNDKGLILEVNFSAATLLGVPKSQLVARPFSRFISPADVDPFYVFFRKLLTTGQPQVCGDLQVLQRAGPGFWATLQGNMITDATGATLINLILADITARKQAEAALRSSESQLQATLESTADGLLAVDNNGKVIKANRNFAELWQIPQSLLERYDDKALLAFVLEQLSDPEAFLERVQSQGLRIERGFREVV